MVYLQLIQSLLALASAYVTGSFNSKESAISRAKAIKFANANLDEGLICLRALSLDNIYSLN